MSASQSLCRALPAQPEYAKHTYLWLTWASRPVRQGIGIRRGLCSWSCHFQNSAAVSLTRVLSTGVSASGTSGPGCNAEDHLPDTAAWLQGARLQRATLSRSTISALRPPSSRRCGCAVATSGSEGVVLRFSRADGQHRLYTFRRAILALRPGFTAGIDEEPWRPANCQLLGIELLSVEEGCWSPGSRCATNCLAPTATTAAATVVALADDVRLRLHCAPAGGPGFPPSVEKATTSVPPLTAPSGSEASPLAAPRRLWDANRASPRTNRPSRYSAVHADGAPKSNCCWCLLTRWLRRHAYRPQLTRYAFAAGHSRSQSAQLRVEAPPREYLRRFGDPKRVVFLWHEPWPFGAVAGRCVPFGEVNAVRDWIDADRCAGGTLGLIRRVRQRLRVIPALGSQACACSGRCFQVIFPTLPNLNGRRSRELDCRTGVLRQGETSRRQVAEERNHAVVPPRATHIARLRGCAGARLADWHRQIPQKPSVPRRPVASRSGSAPSAAASRPDRQS